VGITARLGVGVAAAQKAHGRCLALALLAASSSRTAPWRSSTSAEVGVLRGAVPQVADDELDRSPPPAGIVNDPVGERLGLGRPMRLGLRPLARERSPRGALRRTMPR